MLKLYEIADKYNGLVDLMDDPDFDEGYIAECLEMVNEDFEGKAENIVKVLKSLSAEQDAIKVEEDRLADRRKSLLVKEKSLKSYLENQMLNIGKNKIKTDLFSLNIQKNPPSLNVISEENVPDEFYIVERKLQRTELLKAMKAGLEVEGVEIKQGESLRIR